MSTDRPSLLRRCYRWTLSWAEHPQAKWGLFFVALIEASVFPIPPDVLLLALALGAPRSSMRLAGICTLGSTVGSVIGYAIGMFLFASVAEPLLQFYGAMGTFNHVQELFTEWGIGLVLIAGFSPIPFKVITIAAGAFDLPFFSFLLAAIVSRGARFYLEGALMQWGGDRLRQLVDKYFEWATLSVVVLVVAGFMGLWLFR
ncbi:MAG: cytochrome B [Zetaproteobacteria bacterium CG1_02_49_23]|nr:MAG: cytochrome B [Zetaproteobacteria bacterium CG1_02_49_23]